jgi:hypothetical protein
MNSQPPAPLDEIGTEPRAWGPIGKEFPIRWPERLLGPRPGLRGFTIVCWGFFFGTLVVPLGFALWIRLKAIAACDFVYFYGIGRILREFPSTSLYDLGLQLKTFNGIARPLSGFYGPSPYPPFVAQFFSVLARFPFKTAFLLWTGISLTLCLGGSYLLVKEFFPRKDPSRSLAICFVLAFPPYIMNTLANGQIASVAFCSICVAVYLEKRERPSFSGLALSVLTYKPTLLFLLLPMLIVTRRFKTLLGFLGGASLLLLESTLLLGTSIWPTYLRFLVQFKRISGKSGTGVSPTQFVDFVSFLHGMPGGRSMAALSVAIAASIVISFCLASVWWRSFKLGPGAQLLVWAATITWTLLLNLYVPMYDGVLAAIALILTICVLQELGWKDEANWATFMAVVIFAFTWITEPIARRYGIQPLTVLLIFFGITQLLVLGGLCSGIDSKGRRLSGVLVR